MKNLVEEFNNRGKKTDEPSGLNIEEAKKFIQEEDQFDKQLFREKIKRKHKEEKMKQKEIRRAKRGRVTYLSIKVIFIFNLLNLQCYS
jgi:hypothetical protein